MLEDMKQMALALPEDIAKAKWAGDFARAERLIHLRLEDPRTAQCMRKRLELEQEVLRRLPASYPYTEAEGLALIQKEIPDFTMAELRRWEDRDAADWIYINGVTHLQDRFYESMKKVYPEIAARAHEPAAASTLLDDNMQAMKSAGEAAWHIRMRASLQIRDDSFQPGRKVLVHLPVPTASAVNMQNIHILNASSPDYLLAQEDCLSRTIAFEETMQKNHPFTVEYEYDSVVNYVHPLPEEAAGCPSLHTEENLPGIVFTPFIRALLNELRGSETNPLVIARRIYDYCTTKVTYSFMREYFCNACIPDYCGTSLKGDCGVQALLFITLCRCAGIPARWQRGLYVAPDCVGGHDWAQFYVEPWGWMFADCSFGGSAWRAGSSERHEFYFGNLDPFRMAANSELMMEFDPPKRQYRKDPYDNQSGEAEYEDRGLLAEELVCTQTLLEMKKIR